MSLRDVIETIRRLPTPDSETAAKFQIIRPVLDGLGWDTANPEVLWEHPVGGSKSGGKVDIALRGRRRLVALIEAKAPHQDLNKHVAQVLGYAFYEGINICVLTNGLEWKLYLPKEDGKPEERCFASLDLRKGELDQISEDLEAFLGKENLLSGRSERRAKEVHRIKTKLPGIWSRMVQEPTEKLVELIIDQAYGELKLRPAPEQVKAVLHGSPVPPRSPREIQRPHARGTASTAEPQDSQPKRRSPKRGPKIVSYELWSERHEVSTWKGLLIGVAEALYQRHGQSFADRILDLQGRKHPYASRSENDVRAPKVVGTSGIYLHTNLSSAMIIRRTNELMELFGYPDDDLMIETRTD
ncbi:MAG: hypothetical protein OXI84_05920 [bacterium]|nr:hypothetical protein [bacterium]